MASSFRRVLNPLRAPTDAELLEDLIEFHQTHPAITEGTLGAFVDERGRNGYDLLADAAPHDARTLLDLGSGNGPLARRLLRRTTPTQVIALDACAADLALARQSIPDPRLVPLCEPAHALSLADHSLDAALSHHAFYLFRPLDAVVAQLARCLRPGAPFAFVTSSPEPSPLLDALFDAMNRVVQPHNPHFTGWMDPRVRTPAGLRSLFNPSTGFTTQLRTDLLDLRIAEPTETLIDRLLAFFYTASLLPPDARDELRLQWRSLLRPSEDTSGHAHLAYPSAIVTVWKA